MSDMISIIIPAYNAADYLAQTIESVLNQTYSDFELILIDDGSTDRTREIIKDYQCKDARIKYFYKENGGVSSARNLGLQKAISCLFWIVTIFGIDVFSSRCIIN